MIEVKRNKNSTWRVTVGAHDLRNDWYSRVGNSHRDWVITLNPFIERWVNELDPRAIITEDFMHDDYPCYFHFTFEAEENAMAFVDYLKTEWARPK